MEVSLDPALLWDTGAVKVWIAPLNLSPSALYLLRRTLSSDEQERAARYRLPEMANAFTVRRGLLRVLLGKEISYRPNELRFASNRFGKPVLATDAVSFSVSSSRNYAVWAISKALSVGVDIEWIDPEMPLTALIDDHFTQAEKRELSKMNKAAERADAFFRAWTIKEACAKSAGVGLSAPLRQYAALETEETVLDPSLERFVINSQYFTPKTAGANYWVSVALTRLKT